MFSSSNILSAPAVFQTYLLPSIPFRRRQSSGSNSSFVSYSARHSSFGSPASAATPPTPASPHEAQFFDSSSSSSNPNASGTAYHFQATASPGSLWSRHDSHDSAVSGPYAFSPLRPSYLSGHTSHISCAKCHADFALTSQIISKGFTGRHGRAYLVAPGTSSLTCTPCTSPGGNGSPSLPNTHTHRPVPRHLVTGLHTVADISCAVCGLVIGWKYVAAEEETQRYKVGKFILETRRCTVNACWENEGDTTRPSGSAADADDDGSWFFGGAGMDGIDGGGAKARGSTAVASDPRGSSKEKASEDDLSSDQSEVDDEDVEFDSQDEDECEDLFSGIWSPALAKRRRARKASLAR